MQELSRDRVLFELVGVDAALANALRRLLLAELPSLAIEKVVVFQNTSILPDEVLAHRLGLLPLRADPRLFSFTEGGAASELNTLVFTLDVACTRLSGVADTAAAEDRFSHSLVTSADVRWQPQGRQAEALRAAEPRVYYPDIVIAKLRPGQSIECEMHAEKGRGQQHAKWSALHSAALHGLCLACAPLTPPAVSALSGCRRSPVATASYRMLPDVRIVQPVTGERARQLKAKCPMDVFDIEDVATGAEQGEQQQQQLWRDEEKQKLQQEQRLPAGGAVRAVVARPRNCSMCRECIRGPGWSDSVQLRRERRHFLFSVETTGAYSPPDAVREAVRLLKAKAQAVREELDRDGQQQAEAEDDGGGDDD